MVAGMTAFASRFMKKKTKEWARTCTPLRCQLTRRLFIQIQTSAIKSPWQPGRVIRDFFFFNRLMIFQILCAAVSTTSNSSRASSRLRSQMAGCM